MKTCLKHWRNSENFSLKILVKTMKRWGIYSPRRKLAVRLNCQSDSLPVDRPVDRQRSKIRPLEQPGRPPGRPPRYREQSSLVRSTGRSTGPLPGQTCTDLCTSVDRLWITVDRPGRPPGPGSQISGSEKHVKNISKNSNKLLKIPKNSFIILH